MLPVRSRPPLARAALGAALAALCAPAPGRAQAGAALLDAVPGDALAVFSIEDVAGLRAAGERSAWYRFATDPRVVRLAEQLVGQELAIPPEALGALQIADAVQGAVALFVAPAGAPGQYVGGALVDPGAGAARLAPSFDLMLAHLDQAFPVDSVQHGSVELILFDLGDLDDGPDFLRAAPDPTLVAVELDGLTALFAGAPRERVVEVARGAVDRRLGAAAPADLQDAGFARSEDFVDARRTIGRSGNVELLLASSALLGVLEREMGEELDEHVLDMLAFSGLRDVRWLYASAGVGEGEAFDLTLGMHVPQETPLARAADLMRPVSHELLALMPRDCASLFVLGFDVLGAVELVLDLAEDVVPASELPGSQADAPKGVRERYAEGLAGLSGMTGVDLEEELLAQISGEFGQFMVLEPGAAGGLEDLGSATMLLGIEDGETVALAVETLLESPLLAMLAGDVELDSYGDVDVWRIPGPFGGFGLGWAFLDSALVVSDDERGLEAVLRTATEAAPSVLDHPKLGPAIRAAEGSALLSVADTPAVLEQVLGMLGGTARLVGRARGTEAAGTGAGPSLVRELFQGVLVQSIERGPRSVRLRIAGR